MHRSVVPPIGQSFAKEIMVVPRRLSAAAAASFKDEADVFEEVQEMMAAKVEAATGLPFQLG